MKKDPNSSSSSSERRYGLPRKAILKKQTHFQALFERRVTIYHQSRIQLRFYIETGQLGECKMGFVVSKRLGGAVRRNRMKRLLREAYRLQQYTLNDVLMSAGVNFYGAFVARSVECNYAEVKQEVCQLLERTRDYIQAKHRA